MKQTLYGLILIVTFLWSGAFSQTEKMIPPEQLKEDFTIFKQALLNLHPGIYRYNTPAEIEKSFNEFEKKLIAPLNEKDFFILISQFTSKLKCGHTFLNPLNQRKDVRARFFENKNYFPFYFRLVDRRMIVTENALAQNLTKGAEIKKINGVAVKKIIETLLTVMKGDGNNSLENRLNGMELNMFEAPRYSFFDIYYPLFFPPKNEAFEIEAIDPISKKSLKFAAPAMTKPERTAEIEKRYGKVPTYDDGWFFEIQPDNTAYLRISNSITWRLKTIDYKKFLADAFAMMKEKNAQNLIIDWRENGGGDDELGEILSGYLAKTMVGCFDPKIRYVKTTKLDENILKYLETYDDDIINNLKKGLPDTMYKKEENGLYRFLGREPCQPIQPLVNNFMGRAFVIADASNASAAFQFLRSVRDNHLGTIVGQESGGNRQGINGDNYLFLYLPNSHFEIDLPLFYAAPRTPKKDGPILPDVFVKRRPEDVANNFDRELTTVKKLIQEQAKK